jgi:hypothetical protein
MTKDEALAMDLALEALEYTTTMSKFLLNNEANIGPILKAEKAITAIKQVRALDKKAENAKELGLDYEPVQEPDYWNVINPAGNIVASETDAIRGWARIAGSYKPTVEGLLGFHDQGWRVLPKATSPAQPAPVYVKTFHGGKPWPLHPAPVQPVEINADIRNVLHGALKRSGKVIPPPAQQEPVVCMACEGNPKGDNIPCAVCKATPPAQPAPVPPPWWPAVENILNEYGLQAIDFVADFKAAEQSQRTWVGSGDLEDSNAYQTPPAQLAPVQPVAWTDEQLQMLYFLYGEGEWDGLWFDEKHPTKKRGFWWRSDLRRLFTTPPAAQPAPVQERNFCERCGKRIGDYIHTCTPPLKENT